MFILHILTNFLSLTNCYGCERSELRSTFCKRSPLLRMSKCQAPSFYLCNPEERRLEDLRKIERVLEPLRSWADSMKLVDSLRLFAPRIGTCPVPLVNPEERPRTDDTARTRKWRR
ncbi:uncharacterized protein ARMOST_17574 [Armillaria ostoyae]|uniref:Uncharacterized protein n=1 Tax=Armillaria ostoyae TaxID=47428 RepID=A0A284RZD8_ARMOS|nr:uncharacterized protein ARMOST_17574 [Armillaria ostoyae]